MFYIFCFFSREKQRIYCFPTLFSIGLFSSLLSLRGITEFDQLKLSPLFRNLTFLMYTIKHGLIVIHCSTLIFILNHIMSLMAKRVDEPNKIQTP